MPTLLAAYRIPFLQLHLRVTVPAYILDRRASLIDERVAKGRGTAAAAAAAGVVGGLARWGGVLFAGHSFGAVRSWGVGGRGVER